MTPTVLDILARVVTDLAHTGIVFYVVFSLRVYLTARLDKFGVETLLTPRTEPVDDVSNTIYDRRD